MKQEFPSLESLEKFVEHLQQENKFVFNIKEIPEEKKYILEWKEQKYYFAQDGSQYPDEIWITKEGEMKFIQEIDLEHARNILRMVIRNNQNIQTIFSETINLLLSTLNQYQDIDDNIDEISDPDIENITYH